MRKHVVLLVLVVLVVVTVGIVALSTPEAQAKGGRCVCPQVYAPVICDKGKVFPNQCVADCRRSKNCEPLGVI